jgi:CubicO group peptidase (beta-lactamase class C family)
MKKWAVTLLFSIFFWSGTVWAQSKPIASIVDEYQEFGWFSGVVLVKKGDKEIVSIARGKADESKQIPVNMQTLFDIGSIQKNLTAVLVLQAADNNQLSLDDRLEHFDLGFPADIAKKVTVRHLLEHSSGFADIFTAEYRQNFRQYNNIDKKLALLKDKPLLFEPGNDKQYSNYGYIVLGAILQKVSGQPYLELLQQHILTPIRENLPLEARNRPPLKQAQLYNFDFSGKRRVVAEEQQEHMTPDGGLAMSVQELLGFYQLLFKEKNFLSSKGLQTFKGLQEDQNRWVSFGGGKGVSTAVEIDFSQNVWVVVLANTDELVAEEISGRIMSLFRTGQRESAKLPPTVFTYHLYQQLGKSRFTQYYEAEYKKSGYSQFIGRVVTELARALIDAGKPGQSLPFFEFLVQRYPSMPEVYDGLALGYFSLGQSEKARKEFNKARELQTDYNSQFSSSNYAFTGN